MPSVFFYISGHGFGHASREIEVINTLAPLVPDHRIAIRTGASRWLFDRTVRAPFTWLEGAADTGVTQIDSLRLDAAATIDHAAAFHRDLPARISREVAILREHDARFVIADVPPLACAAAAEAGIPAVALANFTWDWIYEAYPDALAAAPDLLPAIREAYGRIDEAWRLPMHGGFATFRNVVDVPFIARHAARTRAEVRQTLGLPPDRALALVSFGGYGIAGFDPFRLDCLASYGVVITVNGPAAPVPEGVHTIDEAALHHSGVRYEDLVAAVDVVVSKPGFGIISECLANGTALLYTSRGRFVEYDVMVADMPRVLRCGHLELSSLLAGRWLAALTRVVALPLPPEQPPTNGAEIIAARIAERL